MPQNINTALDICNVALLKISQPPIAAFDENNLLSTACELVYKLAMNRVFMEYPWSFAVKKVKVVGQEVNAGKTESDGDYNFEAYGWGKRFALPTNLVKLLNVYLIGHSAPLKAFGETRRGYVIQGEYIYSEEADLVLEYIHDGMGIDKYPEWFKELCAYSIAIGISKYFPNGLQMSGALTQEYMLFLNQCKSNEFDQVLGGQFLNEPPLSFIGGAW